MCIQCSYSYLSICLLTHLGFKHTNFSVCVYIYIHLHVYIGRDMCINTYAYKHESLVELRVGLTLVPVFWATQLYGFGILAYRHLQGPWWLSCMAQKTSSPISYGRTTSGCLHLLGVHFLGVLRTRALLFGVYIGAPDCWKLALPKLLALQTVDS